MNREFDLLIIGAGIVGLTTAALLARDERAEKLRITIVDAGARPVFAADSELALRVSALSPGSVAAITRAGDTWARVLTQRHCPYRAMKVWDESECPDGPETLTFDSADFALPELGFIVENVLLQHELLATLEHTGVSVQFDSPIAAMSPKDGRFSVELTSGQQFAPDLLIGADGARSFVRDRCGIDIRSVAHQQSALVTHLRSEFDHHEVALQRFLADGPIGILPLHDGRVSVVWSTEPQRAAEALAMPSQELAALLTSVSDGALGQLSEPGPRGAFPLTSQHASRYAMDGLVLLGDAAHAIHPLAGQGANLGIADAVTLANVIGLALQNDEHPGDLTVLRRYERARKGANMTMLYFLSGLNKLFSNRSSLLARVRGAGMYAFNHSGLIRQQVVRTALGIR